MTARTMPGPGTRLSVRPGEWKPGPDGDGHTYHDIVVVSVHESHEPAYWWVYGHGPECSWESADCTQPWCFEVLVDLDVLAATAAGERP
ncbi:hypothetical protein LADH09A_004888 [Micromonospora sp. LAH09]|uniref:hypothetical protein n=1 Tax=Micromonospora cabrerizensis TaxID=2911213 RepID=UPI001EE8BE73|nr:hypothetical protein [Micromonospora cabrerizensis]MCG5470916.1 hypothetical protein [Micromonospora cabrerizensis]